MINYEEKYKEMKARVLEIGRGYVKGVDFSKPRQIAEYIDPELKEESCDERIINRIKKAVENYWSDEPLNEILAWLGKQGEQKTSWSAEDEVMFRTAKKIIFESDDCSEGTSYKVIDWLKSLKPQYHWKPEGQQLCCLRHMIDVSTVDKIDRQIVIDLYEQLKSL